MAGAAAADDPPLRVGRLLTFLVDLRSAPATKQTQDTGRGALLTHSTTSLCRTRTSATARCDSAASLSTRGTRTHK